MKSAVTKLLVLALTVMLGGTAVAKEMTLDDCIDLALKTRAGIIASRNAQDLAKVSERAALGAFLPRVSASYDYTKGKDTKIKADEMVPTGYDSAIVTHIIGSDTARDFSSHATDYQKQEVTSPDLTTTTKTLGFGADWSFALPSAWFSYLASKADHESARLDVMASEQDLIYSVKSAYYLYLAAIQNVGVEEDAVKRSDEQLKLIQSKFELGSAAKSDVLKQKVQNGNDMLALLQARNSVTSTKASLAYTVGLDPTQEHEFATTYTMRQYDGTLQDAIQYGLGHKPDLLSAEKSIKAADQRVRQAYALYLPSVSPFASYGYNKRTVATSPSNIDFNSSKWSLTYGLSLNWNIFDGFAREERVASARISKNNQQAQLADSRNLIVSQIKTAYLDIERLKETQKVATDNVDAATEDLKITQEKYNLGAATILDLLNAQVSLRQAQVSQIGADFDLNVAIAKLENAMGKM